MKDWNFCQGQPNAGEYDCCLRPKKTSEDIHSLTSIGHLPCLHPSLVVDQSTHIARLTWQSIVDMKERLHSQWRRTSWVRSSVARRQSLWSTANFPDLSVSRLRPGTQSRMGNRSALCPAPVNTISSLSATQQVGERSVPHYSRGTPR